MTKLGTYLVLRRVWNPIDFQGHGSKVKLKCLGEGIRHALHCPCFITFVFRMEDMYQGPYAIILLHLFLEWKILFFLLHLFFRMEDVDQGLYAIILLHLFLEWKMWTKDRMLLFCHLLVN